VRGGGGGVEEAYIDTLCRHKDISSDVFWHNVGSTRAHIS